MYFKIITFNNVLKTWRFFYNSLGYSIWKSCGYTAKCQMLPNLYACFLILQYNIRPLFEHVTSRAVFLSDRRKLSQNRQRCNDRLFNFLLLLTSSVWMFVVHWLILGLFYFAFQRNGIYSVEWCDGMSDELERIWKEVAWNRWGMRTEFWPENLRGRDHLEDVGIVGRLTLKWILRKLSGRIYTGIILL